MFLRKRTSLLLRVGAGIALGSTLLWWLLRDINTQELFDLLIGFSWGKLIPVLLLVLASSWVRAYRWRLLFHGKPPSLSRLFFVENTGIGLNSVAPVRVLAEPIQFGYLTLRDGHDRGVVLASLVLSRVVDLTVTLGTIVIGIALFPPVSGLTRFLWSLVFLGVAVALSVTFLSLTIQRVGWMRRFPLLVTYGKVWGDLITQRGRLTRIIVVTNVQWGLLGLATWIVAQDVGLGLSFPVVYIATLGIMTLGFTLPGLPSGLGPFEFAAIVILALYGVPREPALAFGLIIHVALLLPPVVVAVTTLVFHGPPWRGRSQPGKSAAIRSPVATVSGRGEAHRD